MYIQKEIVQMPDPELPIKTYIIHSLESNLSSSYHVHEEIEFIYMIKGKMNFWIGTEEVTVNEGKILLINSMAVHASELLGDEPTKMCLLQFKPEIIYNTASFSEFKYLSQIQQSDRLKYHLIDSCLNKDYEILAELLNETVMEFQEKAIAYEISIKSLLYRILTILYRNKVLNYDSIQNLYRQKELLSRFDVVIQYVECHYKEEINIVEVCKLLNVNYYYFCRLFKKAMGITFVQYLNYIRISVAERLLLTTNMPITDIIIETGFSSLSYFNRIFKLRKGCSPTEYRKNALKKVPLQF